MTEEKFKWGIIGPGRIAHSFAKAIAVINNAELYAVASTNEERGKNFGNQYNVDKIYNTYEELVNDQAVNAIYVATPHRFHFEHTLLALKAEKPVLCEKPFTVNSQEAKTLIHTARKKKLFVMEALWTRYLPIYNVVRNWLDDKLIGEIKLLTSTFGYAFQRDLKDRKFNHELAGGGLLDLGVYPIAVSQWVLRKNPISFSSTGYLGETNVDEMLAVNLDYGDGVISQFTCNLLTTNENDFLIYGTKGYIKIHCMFWGATKATLYLDGKERMEERPFRATGFEYQIEEAMNCIKSGKLESEEMTHERTLSNIELMDDIRKSIKLKYSFE